MSKQQIYVTSDLHLGDTNCLDFDNRPFTDLQHMEDQIVKRYNSTVKENDHVYFLGDLGRDIKKVIHRFNGNKHLVFGNHDHFGKFAAYQMGFVSVQYMASINIGDDVITMTHCPLRGVWREDVKGMKGGKPGEMWHGESRHQKFSIPDWGQFHLCGHTHLTGSNKFLDKQYDIGVCGNNYFPVSWSQIESWKAKYKQNLTT